MPSGSPRPDAACVTVTADTTTPPGNSSGGVGVAVLCLLGNYRIGMKIFRPLRLALPASVLRSMKSLADEWPSPVVMAVWP
jgi:hypothetical protein